MKLKFIITRVLDHYHYENNNVIEQRNKKKHLKSAVFFHTFEFSFFVERWMQ